jgi:archaellum component FlaC
LIHTLADNESADDPRFVSETVIEALQSIQDKLIATLLLNQSEGSGTKTQNLRDSETKEIAGANIRAINKARTLIHSIINFVRDSTYIGEHTTTSIQTVTKELTENLMDIKEAVEACSKDVAEIANAKRNDSLRSSDNPIPIRPTHRPNTHPTPTVIDKQRAKARILQQQQQVLIHIPLHLAGKLDSIASTVISNQINENIKTQLTRQNIYENFTICETRKLKLRPEETSRRILLETNSPQAASWIRDHPGCL